MEVQVLQEEEMEVVAQKVLSKILLEYTKEVAKNGPAVLSLCGDLGAGKTTLTRYIARLLGVTQVITSPTFILRSDYPTTHQVCRELIHIDVYRLELPEEVHTIDWENILSKPHTLVIVEWADKIVSYIPENAYTVTIRMADSVRVVSFK